MIFQHATYSSLTYSEYVVILGGSANFSSSASLTGSSLPIPESAEPCLAADGELAHGTRGVCIPANTRSQL